MGSFTMHDIAALADLPDGLPIGVQVDGKDIVLVRLGETVCAVDGKCPHAGAPLADGAVHNNHLICPWHKGVFRLSDGAPVEPPALIGLARYDVEIHGGRVLMNPTPAATRPIAPVSTDMRIVLVLGGGAAAVAACTALRDNGYIGRLIMIGPEVTEPYDRTVLSKFVLAGDMQASEIPPLQTAGYWAARDIQRLDTSIIKLDANTKAVTLADGSRRSYDRAILATGARPKRLNIPGSTLQNIFTLRSRQDAIALAEVTTPSTRVAIVGSSFIGLEAASALRKRGIVVTVVNPEPLPFEKQFGPELAAMFKRMHEANGVQFRVSTKPSRFAGEEQVRAVILEDNTELPADIVLLAVGVRPVTEFVEGVRKADDGGVLVDGGMRATDDLYVVGDCANFLWRGTHTRIEHWRVAQQQAHVAAVNVLGGHARYDGVPFFWTYHYGQNYEYLGHAETWDQIEIVGSQEDRNFVAIFLRDNAVVAVVASGRERQTAILVERMRLPLSLDDARALIQ
jgi:apoptosis-inducing factor 3